MNMTQARPTSTALSSQSPGKALRWGLWGTQILLALAFGMAGFMKTTTPLEQLGKMMPWTQSVPPGMVRFIGTAEFLGALGLILPSATRIIPLLTPLAGASLTVVMALAAGFHATRGEGANLPPTIVLGLLALFVAWGRFRKVPISPRF